MKDRHEADSRRFRRLYDPVQPNVKQERRVQHDLYGHRSGTVNLIDRKELRRG